LKAWDVETGKNTQSYDVPKAIMGMACVAGGGRVAWCGGGDKAVHMWDPRVGATTGATTSLMSHTVRIDRSARFALFEFGFFFSSRLFRSFSRHVSARRRASVMRPHSFPESATTWGTKQSPHFFPETPANEPPNQPRSNRRKPKTKNPKPKTKNRR